MTRPSVWLVLLAILTAGCGGKSVSLVPVEGVVTFNSKPVPEATITFGPLRATDPGPYTATTDAAGHYSMGTTQDPAAGAAPGEYFLFISTKKVKPGVMDGPETVIQKETLPAEYQNSTMRFTVPAEGSTAANFDIKK